MIEKMAEKISPGVFSIKIGITIIWLFASLNINEYKKGENMKKKAISIIVLFFGLPALLLAGLLFLPEKTYSYQERRSLASFPKVSLERVIDGQFEEDIETWLLDQIPARQMFLNLNAWINRNLLLNPYENGILAVNGDLVKAETSINEASLDHAANVFASVYENNIQGTDCKVYFSIVPDKAYYIDDPMLIKMDYDAFFEAVEKRINFAEFVDLRQSLSLEDYYNSDPHWRQEKLDQVLKTITDSLNVQVDPVGYTEQTALENFIGLYGSQSSLSYNKDSIITLHNEQIDSLKVTDYSSGNPVQVDVYQNPENLKDPYALYLSGNPGLMTIENPNVNNGRELILFRDSYGSSLAVLLAQAYEKITLVDLRNFNRNLLKNYVSFTDQDVLFLYSTSILNNAFSLR